MSSPKLTWARERTADAHGAGPEKRAYLLRHKGETLGRVVPHYEHREWVGLWYWHTEGEDARITLLNSATAPQCLEDAQRDCEAHIRHCLDPGGPSCSRTALGTWASRWARELIEGGDYGESARRQGAKLRKIVVLGVEPRTYRSLMGSPLVVDCLLVEAWYSDGLIATFSLRFGAISAGTADSERTADEAGKGPR